METSDSSSQPTEREPVSDSKSSAPLTNAFHLAPSPVSGSKSPDLEQSHVIGAFSSGDSLSFDNLTSSSPASRWNPKLFIREPSDIPSPTNKGSFLNRLRPNKFKSRNAAASSSLSRSDLSGTLDPPNSSFAREYSSLGMGPSNSVSEDELHAARNTIAQLRQRVAEFQAHSVTVEQAKQLTHRALFKGASVGRLTQQIERLHFNRATRKLGFTALCRTTSILPSLNGGTDLRRVLSDALDRKHWEAYVQLLREEQLTLIAENKQLLEKISEWRKRNPKGDEKKFTENVVLVRKDTESQRLINSPQLHSGKFGYSDLAEPNVTSLKGASLLFVVLKIIIIRQIGTAFNKLNSRFLNGLALAFNRSAELKFAVSAELQPFLLLAHKLSHLERVFTSLQLGRSFWMLRSAKIRPTFAKYTEPRYEPHLRHSFYAPHALPPPQPSYTCTLPLTSLNYPTPKPLTSVFLRTPQKFQHETSPTRDLVFGVTADSAKEKNEEAELAVRLKTILGQIQQEFDHKLKALPTTTA